VSFLRIALKRVFEHTPLKEISFFQNIVRQAAQRKMKIVCLVFEIFRLKGYANVRFEACPVILNFSGTLSLENATKYRYD